MENQKPNPPQDEIDLGRLLSRMGNGFRNLGFGFIRFLAKVRRAPFENKLSFISIIGTSVIIGVLFSVYLSKNYYESTMILSSNYLNKRLAESTVKKLSTLAQEGDKAGLARTLSLPDTLADNIIGFEVRPFVPETDIIELEVLKEQLRSVQTPNNQKMIEQVVKRIEIENRHAFEITVRTLSPSVIPNLQDAILNYFRSNPYIRKRIEVNRSNLEQRKEKLTSDLRKLDSLKRVIYQNYRTMAEQTRQGSNNVILSDKAVTDPVEIYNQDILTYNEYQEVERLLYIRPDFEIVDGFTQFSEPASPSIPRMIFYSILIGIAIAYLDIALRSFNSYLSQIK